MLPLAMPASYELQSDVLGVVLPIQLPANVAGKATEDSANV